MTVSNPSKRDAASRRARRIPADEYHKRAKIAQTLNTAKEYADQLIAEAERESEAVLAEVQNSLGDVVQIAEAKVAEQLAIDIAKKREAESEIASHELFALSRAIWEDFEAVDAWLVDLIMTSLGRIFDDMGAETRAKGLVRAALAETKSRWALRIKVHPCHAKLFQTLLDSGTDAFRGIESIQSDNSLTDDEVLLESAGGLTNISHKDQLRCIQKALEDRFVEGELC